MDVTKNPVIDLEDWVCRFFGFLGGFTYLRGQKRVEAPRKCADESGKPILLADNILYIYGVPKGGKSSYRDLLIERLRTSENYTGVRFLCADRKGGVEFQTALRDSFLAADSRMRFPFMNLLADYKRNDFITFSGLLDNYASGVEDIFSGNPFKFAKGIKEMATTTAEARRYYEELVSENQKLYRAEIAALRKQKKADPSGSLFDEKDPFKFLRYDLNYNSQLNETRRYICFVDKYELTKGYLSTDAQKEFLLLMASVPHIVWVLFSTENPGRHERRIIDPANCWRMSGLNREQTMEFLKSRAPDECREWYSGVYRHTGGHPGLMELCLRAQHHPERRFVVPDSVTRLRSGGTSAKEGEKEYTDEVNRLLSRWFEAVWNDGPWPDQYGEEEPEREDPIAFLLESAFLAAERYDGNEVDRNLIPCLCYLAEKSADNLRTIRQYSWQKDINVNEFNATGRACLRRIESYTPLCREYVEYPGVLYLDPVIVEILRKHRKYSEWLDRFRQECMRTVSGDLARELGKETVPPQQGYFPQTATLQTDGALDGLKDDTELTARQELEPVRTESGELHKEPTVKAAKDPAPEGVEARRQEELDAERNQKTMPVSLDRAEVAKEEERAEKQGTPVYQFTDEQFRILLAELSKQKPR